LANPDPIAELVSLFARLPGVGERTASRLAFHVLASDPDYARALGKALSEVHERVRRCQRCGNYGAEALCRICRDARRDSAVVCIVARVPDLHAIERSGTFHGRYHVLHGLLAPLDGIGPAELPLDILASRVAEEGIREIIVATPLNVEGEATALYVAQLMKDKPVSVTRIASGVPHGGELEFTDQVTLGRALEGRKRY
jgi:recombination protein RecR